MEKVIITGGLGQIGSICADVLSKEGYKIIVIDNLSTGRREHVSDDIGAVHIASIENREHVFCIFKDFQPDIVIHAAASFKDPNDFIGDTRTNCLGSVNVFDACKEVGVKRLIYLQTSLCYGTHGDSVAIDVDTPLSPGQSSYAISKTTAEWYLQMTKLNFVTFRLANVIGPRNLTGPLPVFYYRLTHGLPCVITNSKRDFVSAYDLALLISKACKGIGQGAYHFSSGKDIKVLDLFKILVKQLGLDVNRLSYQCQDIKQDDVATILLNPARTIKDFGQIIHTPIERIVEDAIDYYQKYGVTHQYTHLKIY